MNYKGNIFIWMIVVMVLFFLVLPYIVKISVPAKNQKDDALAQMQLYRERYAERGAKPDKDMKDMGDYYLVVMDLPRGTLRGQIKVRIAEQKLFVAALYHSEAYTVSDSGSSSSTSSGSLDQSFPVPSDILIEGAKAGYSGDTLQVKIPKRVKLHDIIAWLLGKKPVTETEVPVALL